MNKYVGHLLGYLLVLIFGLNLIGMYTVFSYGVASVNEQLGKELNNEKE